MASGLLALLDDVAAIAKVAATSIDDATAQAAKAGSKAAGIVIDDAAVTPRYVVGFAADRELPIIAKIALGSLKNKLIFLLPGALFLSLVAPWIITPLLMVGGCYLCLEGFHKVMDYIQPQHAHHDEITTALAPQTPAQLEQAKVESAIRTDFILSAEIMAITLASVTASSLFVQGTVLAVVGVGMTVLVYGAVAIIVKADDVGAAWATSSNRAVAAVGRALVVGMPGFLATLSFVGMLAMLWVGGGIVIHGVHALGWHGPEALQHGAAEAMASWLPGPDGAVMWGTGAFIAGLAGLCIGALVAPVVEKVVAPLVAKARGRFSPEAA